MVLISEVKFKAAKHYRKPSEPVASDHEIIDCMLRMTFDRKAAAKRNQVINGVEYCLHNSFISGIPDVYSLWFNGTVRHALGLELERTQGVYKLEFTPSDIRKDHISMMAAMMEAIKDILEQEQKTLN